MLVKLAELSQDTLSSGSARRINVSRGEDLLPSSYLPSQSRRMVIAG